MGQFGYKRLTTAEDVRALISYHNRGSAVVALDTETTGLDPFTDRITLIVLSGYSEHQGVCFGPEFLPELAKLRVKTLVLHNFRFDYKMLHRAGLDMRTLGHDVQDTMLLDHLLNEEASHALDSLVQRHWGDDYKSKFWAKYKSFEEAPEEEQLEYACKDVVYTRMAYGTLRALLAADEVPDSLIEHVHRLALALYDTEQKGICVDLDYLMQLGGELKPAILDYRGKMQKVAHVAVECARLDKHAKEIEKAWRPRGTAWQRLPIPEFNWDSHQQLGALLYDKLGLPQQTKYDKKTRTQRRTVDDDALAALEGKHPIVPMLREYSGYQKVYTAFIEGTLQRMRDRRIYPSFNVNGTVTGRISSSDPNMQQLPSKGEWAKVRGIYIPDPGHLVISCDYAQLEVVVAAHFSQDPNLLRIVHEGASKHDITAEGVGLPRSIAKTLNFAMQYQCSPRKVAEIVGCGFEEAESIWNRYWETYAKEKEVIDECKYMVDMGHPIVSPFGRHRRFPTDWEKPWHKAAAYRQAYSSLIQGTGADATHRAFYRVAEQLQHRGWGRALFEVHDEIVISVKAEHATAAQELLKACMVEAGEYAKLTVPLSVECSPPLARWEK